MQIRNTTVSFQEKTHKTEKGETVGYLDIVNREDANTAVLLSLVPVLVDLSQQVNHVISSERELPVEKNVCTSILKK